MGRKKHYTPRRLAKIRRELERYIEETEIPVLSEFAYRNGIPRQTLYEFEELRPTIQRLRDKKCAALQREGLRGGKNLPFVIFALKQLGWRDTHVVDVRPGEGDVPPGFDELPPEKKIALINERLRLSEGTGKES